MTISTTTSRIIYAGDGVTVSFAVPFSFFGADEIDVIERNLGSGSEALKVLTTDYTVAGGGGGAGQTGQLQNGGNGLQNSITGTAVYYAGGGGAGGWTSSAYEDGYGGLGGGGAGGGYGTSGNKQARAGFAGATNTGGGGGAGNQASGANGGSGIVVIRYPNTYAAASGTTGSPTITTAGGYRIYQWTSSGSMTF